MNERKGFKGIGRFLVFLHTLVLVSAFNINIALASGDYAKNASSWLLEQASWVLVAIIAVVAIVAFMKRSFTSCIITILVGGILLFFINDKEASILKSIGEAVGNIIFK